MELRPLHALRYLLPHLVYNGALVACVVAVLISARKRPGARWLLAVPLLVAGGALLAGLLGVASVLSPFGSIGPFGVIGLVACTVFAHVALVLAGLALAHWKTHRNVALVALAGVAIVAAIAVQAFLVEPRDLQLSRVSIESQKLDRPLRIAVLADIQTNSVGEYERRAIELAMAQAPDLVLFPGDFIQVEDLEPRRVEREKLRRILEEVGLGAPLGAYAVRGNVDADGWEECFAELPVHCFRRSGKVELGELTITGLDMPDSFDKELVIPESDGFHLVFGHAPDFALGEVEADLLVAGHCHGGQVRLPFFGPPMTLSDVPDAWTSGAREVRPGTWLVVSRGIGLERAGAPPLRFNCTPEVVVIDVVPARDAP